MSGIDHISFSVSDFGAAKAFYAAALKPLGITILMEFPKAVTGSCDFAGLGANGKPFFWLTDTGKTAAIVRAMMPRAHFATVYAKPKGRPLVDTFVTEVSQDTWIYFPWDMGFTYQKPIADDRGG